MNVVFNASNGDGWTIQAFGNPADVGVDLLTEG